MIGRLNVKFLADYGQLIADCNKWVCPVKVVGNLWSFPIVSGGLTVAQVGVDAFQLQAAGQVQNGTFNIQENNYLTIQRFFIPYTQAVRYLEGTDSLLVYIKTALDTIHQIKGFSYNELSYGDFYLSFSKLGHNDEIFREMENAAGFELRAISNSIRPGMILRNNNE